MSAMNYNIIQYFHKLHQLIRNKICGKSTNSHFFDRTMIAEECHLFFKELYSRLTDKPIQRFFLCSFCFNKIEQLITGFINTSNPRLV